MSAASIALVGPTLGDIPKLEAALRKLVFEQHCDHVFYFGEPSEANACFENIMRDVQPPESLMEAAVSLALMEDEQRSAAEIGELLDRVQYAQRLRAIRIVPDAPKKHIELILNRLMLITRDHKHLGEDDIANATLIAYANKKKSVFKRFGKRAFFAPPPLAQDALGMLTTKGSQVDLAIVTLGGETTWTEPIVSPKSKMTVSA